MHEFEPLPSYFNFGTNNIYNEKKLDQDCEDGWVATKDFLCIANGVGNWKPDEEPGFSTKVLAKDTLAAYDKDPTAVKKPDDLFEYVREANPKEPAIGLSSVILAQLSQMPADEAVNAVRDGSGKCAN